MIILDKQKTDLNGKPIWGLGLMHLIRSPDQVHLIGSVSLMYIIRSVGLMHLIKSAGVILDQWGGGGGGNFFLTPWGGG